ncbi:MAG: GNAT family N-acetyltransferase [bacterium]
MDPHATADGASDPLPETVSLGRPDAAVTIRPATVHDADAVTALVRAAYAHYVPRIGREPLPMTADHRAQIEAGTVWVAPGDGRIRGVLVLVAAPDQLLVDNLAVDPRDQGTGLGGLLLAFAEDRARAAGRAEVRLYTHEKMVENRAFYARRGFVETGQAQEDGLPRVFLRKPV